MLYIKALHIIFVVTWFAGLFYLPRLLVYHKEAELQPAGAVNVLQDQLSLMTSRLLYIIAWPSCILTFFFGFGLVHMYPSILTWLWIKIGLVFCLLGFQIHLTFMHKKQKQKKITWTSQQLRMYNEIPTVLLVSIVLLVILRDGLDALTGTVIFIGTVMLLLVGVKIYKHIRLKK